MWALVLLPLAAVLGALAARLWLAPAQPALQSGTLLATPRSIGDFSLTGDDGQPFTRGNLIGRWNLIFTGFTHCPDVCPTTLSLLKSTVSRLGPGSERLQVVFLSVDPERDTPTALAQYVHYFNPRFRAATAANAELDRLAPQLGFVYAKVPGPTPDSYTMDHSAALILINPRGELAGYFTPPFAAETLAADLQSLLKSSS